MNRRLFGMSVLGMAASARAAFAQAPPSWSQFKPAPGSLKEKMHTGQQIRSAAATLETTRAQMQEMIKKNGGVDLFSLDAQHRPNSDERELVRFCKAAEELGAGVQLRIQHPKLAYLVGRYADLGVLAVMVPLVEVAVKSPLSDEDVEELIEENSGHFGSLKEGPLSVNTHS